MGLSFISAHSIGLEPAVGRIVKLDVVGTPVIRHWHIVHRSEKKLLPQFLAVHQNFLAREARSDTSAERLS